MQQVVPFRQSSVNIHFNSNLVVMTTENVARLCLKEPSVSPVMWHQRSVEIDGIAISAAVKHQGKLISSLKDQRSKLGSKRPKHVLTSGTLGSFNFCLP